MLEASDEPRRAAAERALDQHGHERVVLDVLEADLRHVEAMWIAESGDVDWNGDNALFPLMSVALSRGMPLLASGSGVQALVTAGLLPGQLGEGRGGLREMTVVADGTAWSTEVGIGTAMSLPVDEQWATWVIDPADLLEHWHPVAQWTDGGTAAVVTSNGNLVGVLGAIDAATDPLAQGWLARPVAMVAGSPLLDEEDPA